ncbi:peptide chain release factor 1 [Bittarella massiliensis (ex Durand et al. 2017)]|uniref:Peptide chain release factor 1 n=2 Tax=Bittarella massiliensis (ex Durand et al. 2017) TaxID=1720313 RepID=A0AAQ1MBV5_9FIRM|nr:peptide chain release factor 1 [Clostridium sp. ATCC 29733]SHF79883.1 peptide chain release factor 1 [Bittarella massiliensis (ex Durand et al. 2017)]
MADMFDRLRSAEERFEQLNELLMDPAVVTDQNRYRDLMREHKQLTPIVEKYREHMAARQERDEAKAMLDEGGLDKDFKEMVLEQLDESGKKLEQTSEELRILLLPQDPNDDKNVIIEIRGGAGGDEAALFANTLYRMYSMYAEQKGWKSEIMYASETELGGFKEISFAINGDGAYSRLKFESGVHRVQRVPETEAAGRIHTSTVTVAVLPEAEEVDVDINPTDLQIDTYRSGGAGGQHVNKTESAIRITHLPTGIVVECQDERSQYKNKDKAMKVLRSRILEGEMRRQQEEIAAERRSQVGTGDRSERIRTYNYPQGRVTDHRIGLTLYKLEAILNGALDEIIDALITADQAEKLKAQD